MVPLPRILADSAKRRYVRRGDRDLFEILPVRADEGHGPVYRGHRQVVQDDIASRGAHFRSEGKIHEGVVEAVIAVYVDQLKRFPAVGEVHQRRYGLLVNVAEAVTHAEAPCLT